MKITIPISVGELLDKISILKIKSNYTNNFFVQKELKDLINIAKNNKVYNENDLNFLLDVNKKLWDIEDELRFLEKKGAFDEKFIELARFVYKYNDQRAKIKKEINHKYNSDYMEIKCYR